MEMLTNIVVVAGILAAVGCLIPNRLLGPALEWMDTKLRGRR